MGLLAWTLFEYISHRFIGHWRDRLCEHHVWPRDYRVGPSWFSVFVLLVLFWTVCSALGQLYFAAGFSIGYNVYAVTHYFLHHGPAPRWWLTRKLLRNHNVHHFIDDSSNFGVTSPLWDIVFRTYKSRKARLGHS